MLNNHCECSLSCHAIFNSVSLPCLMTYNFLRRRLNLQLSAYWEVTLPLHQGVKEWYKSLTVVRSYIFYFCVSVKHKRRQYSTKKFTCVHKLNKRWQNIYEIQCIRWTHQLSDTLVTDITALPIHARDNWRKREG